MPLLPQRLNTRIILIVSCVLLATGVTYGWISARNQTASLLADMRLNSSVLAVNFAESCARYLLIQDYAELESFLLKSAEISGIRRLQLCEPDGTLIWDVSRTDGGQPLARTGVARISPPAGRTVVMTLEDKQLVIWQPVMAGGLLGWLRADFSLSAIRDAQARTWERTLLMSVAWVVCSALLVVVVLGPIVRAIKRLTEFATQLDDHKGAQIDITGQPLEISNLGASLNEASIKLHFSERLLLDEQERLHKSEENYRRLLDTIQEGIWVIDTEAVTSFVNPRMAEILGYTVEEMLGRPLFSFMDEQGRLIAETNIERRKQGVQEQHDFEFIRKDGSRIYTRLETGPILDEAGQYAGSIAAVADITERKRAELQLHASEEAFRAVVENSPDVIVRYDREGRRIYVNPEFERVNRLTARQVLGKKPVELSTELAPMADVFTEKLMEAMATGTTTKIDLSWSKEGKPVCWYVRVVPEFNTEGSVVSALTIWSDISERKQTEESLQRLNRKLRALSSCNEVLVRAESERSLLSDICRIVCDEAGYLMAWVGITEHDDARTVRPEAWAGVEDGYLAGAGISWGDSEHGHDPTGTAIRTGLSSCIQDFATEPAVAPWREHALQRGYRSSIALPLKSAGPIAFGVLTIYSSEPNAFTPDEITLLEELSGNLAYGIESLRSRMERKRAVEALNRLNDELEQRVKERTAELEEKNTELARMNKIFVGRELRMVELKQRITELEGGSG